MKITKRREELAAARLSVLAEASTGTQYRAAGIEENAETTLAEDGVKVTAAAKWGHIRHHIADYAACTADQDDAETLTALYKAVGALDENELDAYRRGERDTLPAEITARVRHDLGPCGEVLLPLPARFRNAYAAELADIHNEADSALYRQVWQHITSGRTTAPRWLLGPLADVAALLADLDEESDLPAAILTARRRSTAELLALLDRHGARPWPRTGHGVRPWGDEPAHCDDCAGHIGHRAPAAVVAAEAAVDKERADRRAAELPTTGKPFPRFKLEPGPIDVDVPGWELTGDKETGEYITKCHGLFHPTDENADIEAAMTWAEQIIGARQTWVHVRERGFDRWEAGTRD